MDSCVDKMQGVTGDRSAFECAKDRSEYKSTSAKGTEVLICMWD
jgi:hypothetical protein